MKIELRPLDGTELARAWMAEAPTAVDLFPGDPHDIEAYRAKGAEVDRRFGPDERRRAAAHLTGGGAAAEKRLGAFIDGDGFMVTTGQQPALFGGPLYALYKGLTAAALAHTLEESLDRPVLPVFWVASEDHSWDELRRTHLIDVDNELRDIELPARDTAVLPPVHRVPMGPEVSVALDRFLDLLPDTEFKVRWQSLLERAYLPEHSLAEGFSEVLHTLLGDAGVFLVQAHRPELKAGSLAVLLHELGDTDAREDALADRARLIEAAGYETQVPILEGATNLFLEGPGGRERLFRDGKSFRLRRSGQSVDLAEIERRAREDPSVLSPNVLLRPVVESALLPTLSYVAGPGEAAYLAQVAPMFAAHGIEQPIVHPRMSAVVVESKTAKVLTKFGLDIDRLAAPHHELAGRLAREELPDDVEAELRSLRAAIGHGVGDLLAAVTAVDPTLDGPVQSLRSQSFGALSEIERKVVQSLKRQNEVALAQVAKAQVHLFPGGTPQERVLSPFYYLVRYDVAFLDQLREFAMNAVLIRP